MRGDDRYDRKREEGQLVAMPYLFGYQKHHSGPKKQEWKPSLVVMAEAMPKCARADGRGQGYHKVLKAGIVHDIHPKHRQTGDRQRKNSTMYRTKHRSGDAQGVPVDSPTHSAKITLLQQCCKYFSMVEQS
jgi:hypothetical protein